MTGDLRWSRLVSVGVAALVVGCGSSSTRSPTLDTSATNERPAPSPDIERLDETRGRAPTHAELASALYEARLYTSASWLYGRLLEHNEVEATEVDRVLFRRAVSLLLSGGAREVERARQRAAAGEHLERLVELFPESVHRPSATALLTLIEALESVEGDLARTQRQLDALREIDLEQPPR